MDSWQLPNFTWNCQLRNSTGNRQLSIANYIIQIARASGTDSRPGTPPSLAYLES